VWVAPFEAYKHPDGKPMFELHRKTKSLSAEGAFADTETVSEVEAFPWPDPEYLDFSDDLQRLRESGDSYRLSGMWSQFFHIVSDFFGMENYFIKMYTHPDVVHAVTSHVVDFFLEANSKLFREAGDEIDAFFFGNDFGTQLDLLISPESFREFVFPYFTKLSTHAQKAGYQVVLHSCGSIYRVIPDLIDMGVQALHPLQAKAARMSADILAAEFKGDIAFVGGVDTQELLISATPAEIKEEVHRLIDLLGPALVISPSHEAVLPNVPPENLVAMSEAAFE
jgi:uroporphyrinogen decarboxylase